jgi:[ribosomal protein S18]-alanine N-acetyltransferase
LACQSYALAHGRRALRLEVRADNGAAIALYERLGFREFGRYDYYYADGARALRFEKALGAPASPE